MKNFVLFGDISNSNMASSSGRKRHKSSGFLVLFVYVLYNLVPYGHSFSLIDNKLTIRIPHTVGKGFTVLKTGIPESCIEIEHVQRSVSSSNKLPFNPFTILKDGSFVVKSSVHDSIGDMFVIRPKQLESCIEYTSVSENSDLLFVEIVHSDMTLSFKENRYDGLIKESAPVGTKVKGIQNLYACSVTVCSNNLEYRIEGSHDFYLETISMDGHVQLEIYNKNPLQNSVYSFIIVAQNADGLQGRTSISVKVTPGSKAVSNILSDDVLYFSSASGHRHKRATTETLTAKQVPENSTGVLFTLPNVNSDWTYRLSSSTYQNAFAVSEAGVVSVAPNFKLDYESLVTPNQRLSINVFLKTDDSLVKELIQPIEILDVNDEPPFFTNIPTPFLAAVSLTAPSGTLVYSLTAADPDSGAQITLEQSPETSSNANNYFRVQIQANVATIERIGSQSFTENQEFKFVFIATDTNADSGAPQRKTAEVEVLAGSRKPQFMKNSYSVEFEERNPLKQEIQRIDVFSFQNNPVSFSILDSNLQTSTDFGTEVITGSTGRIKSCNIIVLKVMDYETPPRTFNVKIRATEENTGLYSDQDVVISVTDNNEFAPRFSVSTYRKENTPENIAIGTSVLEVTASDLDYNTNLSFSVDNDHFRVERVSPSSLQMPQRATIYVNKKLDYDRISPKNYDFNVKVMDDGEIPKTSVATVRVFMTNLNDEAPVFPDPMNAEIRYDSDVGDGVYIVQATDADQGDKVFYEFVQNYANFAIDNSTGRITLRQTIPTNTESYLLLVKATDDGQCCGGNDQLSSTGTVSVSILTDNLYRPEFKNCLAYEPEVKEEEANAPVITVQATDEDIGSNGRLTYSIREANSRFRINSTSGQLFTAEKIDRESLGVSKTVPVNVIATDGGNLQGTCSLLVKILDINDNPPIFVTSSYEPSVEKSLPPGAVAALVEATDADSQKNGEVQYSFTLDGNPGGYFKLDEPSYTGQIKVNKSLQQLDDDSVITLQVEARDGGTPSFSANVTVTIKVTSDSTQLRPIFYGAPYSARVNESITSAMNILTFVAQARGQSNPKISFKVVDQNSVFRAVSESGSTGTNQTGYLRLRPGMVLDSETTETYSLTLRASDVSSIYFDERVTVDVTDTNDNIPQFVGTNPETGFLDLSLLEGDYTSARKEVGSIRAIDNDRTSPNNQIVGYKIISQNSLFTIDSNSGMLYTQAEFDRESPNFIYTIEVAAIDGAPSAFKDQNNDDENAPNTGMVTVKITIEDVNDNPPSFPQDDYTFEVPEDLPIGDRLPNNAKVTATDPDSAAVLTYSVSPLPSSNLPPPFSIQSQTAHLTVAGSLDYDKGPLFQQYEFLVNVFDGQNTASTKVTIKVLNVNDNSPNVTSYTYTNLTEEDQSIVGPLLTVEVTDKDGDIDKDGIVRFWFELKFTDDKDKQYFAIDQTTGLLSIVKPLDRDLPNGNAEFIFTVEVADEDPNDPAKTPRYGFGEIVVKPIDINDNPPMFPDDGLQMTVMENQAPGAFVGRVEVIDYDEGVNAEYDLQILMQSPDPMVKLEGLDLKTTKELDRETLDKYFIKMQAVDKGPGNNVGTATVTITVGDENDNPPEFNKTYSFMLSEHQTSGEFGRIRAYDKDIGPNAVLTYTLASKDTVYFGMDKDEALNEGVLKVYQPVDYDDLVNLQRNFNLTAYAVDPDPGPNNENRARTFIEVVVTDYNDEIPKFKNPKQQTSVAENAKIGTTLATFTATDRDVDDDYKKFEYYISRKQDSDPTRRFTIDQNGAVTILNPLDRETVEVHDVKILAIDNIAGSPQNTGTATLTVTVTDINDNCPDFAQDYSKTVSVMENEDFNNAELVTITATDADIEANSGPYSFELRCPSGQSRCSQFSLTFDPNGDNGQGTAKIFVSGNFDRESDEGKFVSLPIYMCDVVGTGRSDQQCCTRELRVTIQDKNDNRHSDGYQNIVVYNYKGLFGNIEIGTVNANDPDDMDQDKEFTLLNQDVAGYFVSIDRTTGKITLLPNVPEMSFEVMVRVQNQSSFSSASTVITTTSTVRIQIVHISEDAVFNSGSIRINGISPEDFIHKPPVVTKKGAIPSQFQDSMLEKLQQKLAEKLYGPNRNDINHNLDNVQIVSVMGDETHTDVRFAAHGSPYYQSSRLDGLVTANKTEFENLMQTQGVENAGKIDMVPIDMCQFETCEGGCFNELVVTDNPKMYNTKGASYVGVDTNVKGECGCRATTFPPTIECTPGYCYHGGICNKNDWGVVSCDCPDGFEGPRCQKLRQSFDGTGYALYKQLEQCEQSRTSIEFMTKKATALILYNGPVSELEPVDPRDFLLLELKDGKPRMRINHGTGDIAIEITGGNRLDNGAWHRIDIFRDGKNVRMVVDHCVDSTSTDRTDCEVSGVTRGENIYINVVDVLQLGGRMSSPSYPPNVITDRFVGCMRNLIHNKEVYDLSTGGQFPGAKDGCDTEDNACGERGCGQGQCSVTGVSIGGDLEATCVCDPGYRKATFDGICNTNTTQTLFKVQSYMDWEILNTFKLLLNSRQMTVTFHFRTRDTEGLMFYVSHENDPNKYILFKIVGGKLQVSYNLGDDAYDILLSNVPNVADGYWHMVTLERYGKEFILKMDSGEGRYYTETLGPVNGVVDFSTRQNQIYGGASVSYTSGVAEYVGEDFENSCLNDIRYDNRWFPMQSNESSLSQAATLKSFKNIETGCDRNLCTGTVCSPPFVCKDLWGDFSCVCPENYIKSGSTCLPIDHCADGPCFTGTCVNSADSFMCRCTGGWYGPICQCHPDLNPGGEDCERESEEEPVVAFASGAIIGIVLGILFLIVVIVIIVWLLFFRRKPAEKEPFDEDMEDDIRENIMYYDEEGAGEEDHTQYDLSRLRKPDTGELPFDAPDIRKQNVKPLNSSADRPEVGDFIHNRLNDADDDQNSPPYDTPHDFNFEGGSSDAGSLSSLNTSSSGSQDYDYLNEWGPKFAKLADMYNNYDDAE